MITRFAPSPTGPLHLGHAYAALFAYDMAQAAGGRFLVRIEDIDQSRARPEWEAQIYADLEWLGLRWPRPVMRQSDRMQAYGDALDRLWGMGLLYPCRCNRRDIAETVSAPHHGPDGIVYPGTCRNQVRTGKRPEGVLRLDMAAALAALDLGICYNEKDGDVHVSHEHLLTQVGDIVVARRDMGVSYHLAVVVDDAAQSVTHVTRGADLQGATPIHIVLQKLLRLPAPQYIHHRLITDDAGKRLAKRDDARALAKYRAEGASPADIRAMVGL